MSAQDAVESAEGEPSDLVWVNGEFVAWEGATVYVLTHGLHYGTGVFEGIRCYDSEFGQRRAHGSDCYTTPPCATGWAAAA